MAWIDEFLDEYNSVRAAGRIERREERALRSAVEETSFVQNAHNPASIMDMYAGDPTWPRLSVPQAPVNIMTGGTGLNQAISGFNQAMETQMATPAYTEMTANIKANIDARAAAFAGDVERVYYENREQIPFEWLMAQDPDDLRLLGGDFTEAAKRIESQERYEAYHATRLQEVETETDRRLESYERRNSFSRILGTVAEITLPGGRQIAEGLIGEDSGPSREEIYKQVREEFLAHVEKPEAERGFMQGGAEWALTGVGTALQAGLGLLDEPIALAAQVAGYGKPMSAEQEEAMETLRADEGMPDGELIKRYQPMVAEQAWEQLIAENPEVHAEYLAMGGGDPLRAFGFFGADLDETPEVQDQMAQMANDDQEYLRNYVDLMEEQDYRVSGDLLDMMAAYGTYVPMQLATGIGILLTDEDMRSGSLSERWALLGDEIVEADYTPSRAMGLDGTFVGLGLDLGAGIAFDPTTWVFGPRLNNTGFISSADDVARLARTPVVKRTVDDLISISRSPSHGDFELAALASFLDVVPGATDDLFDALGVVSKTLPDRPYAFTGAAKHTQEVRVGALANLLDETAGARLASEVAPPGLVDDITKRGFDEPLTLGVTREGNVFLHDGYKRLEASMEMNLDAVPVRLELLAEAPAGQAGVALRPESLRKVERMFNEPVEEGAQRFMRPGQLFDDEFVYGAVNRERITKIITDSMLNGAMPPSATRLATAAGFTGKLRSDLRSMGAPGKWLERYMTPQLTVKRLEAFGPTAMPKMVETIVRLFGDDTARADIWLNRLFAARKNAKHIEGQYLDDLAGTAPLKAEIKALEDAMGGGWDDSLRHLEEANPLALGDEPTLYHGSRFSAERPTVESKGISRGGLAADPERALRYASNEGVLYRVSEADLPPDVASHPRRGVGDPMDSGAGPRDIENFMADDNFVDALDWGKPGETIRGATPIPVRDSIPAAEARRMLSQRADELRQARINRDQLRSAHNIKSGQLDDSFKRLDELRRQADVSRANSAAQVMRELYEDYNREILARSKGWKALVDPETGMVPWDKLQRGKLGKFDTPHEGVRDYFPQSKLQESGLKANDIYRDVSSIADLATGIELPVSPLDLIIASEYGAAQYTKFAQYGVIRQVRSGLQGMHALWIMDKVMRPATAATVSVDELLRIFHVGGIEAVTRYTRDKALFARTRAAAVAHGRRPTVAAGAEFIGTRGQNRLREIADYPTLFKQAERQVFDGIGLGYSDLAPSDPGYLGAAERWAAGFTQDSGFRAMLRGEDAFREWFMGPDGHTVRQSVALGPHGTSVVKDWQEVYMGWRNLYEKVILGEARKKGMSEVVDRGFRAASEAVDAGKGNVSLSREALANLGSVRGVKKYAREGGAATRMSDSFFEHFFMDPVNYRRGLMSDLIRKKERMRLMRLYASQNKRVVPNTELDEILRTSGFSSASSSGARGYATEVAMRNGMVPESYIDDLVEMRVVEEIDNTLFTWDQGSRMGQQGKMIFPFGRPWADMAGFWGREVLAKPAMRGMFSNRVTEALTAKMLFNPKPMATWSRLAATNFEVDSIAPGVGLPGDAESMDFSPLLFIPTDGSNPFGMTLPGLGFIPLYFIDRLVSAMSDPMEDPEGYQQLLQTIGDFIPAAEYQRGGTLARVLGGGNIKAAGLMAFDAMGGQQGVPFYNFTSEIGDISREIDRGRAVGTALTDDVLADIFAFEDPEAAQVYLENLILKSDKEASYSSLASTATRTMVPVRALYDDQVTELQDIWIEATERFPDDLPVDLTNKNLEDPDIVRQVADDVRDLFFELPQWKRDVLITQQPRLAVNLIGSWEWTPLAVNALGAEATTSYRTAGNREALARHQLYIDQGYVRPLQPMERVNRILGMIQASQESAAKQIYETSAEFINENMWATMPPEILSTIETVASDPEIASKYSDPQDVWRNWSDVEGILEERYIERARAANPNLSQEELEDMEGDIKRQIGIPSQAEPWGSSWPGLDDENLSKRFQSVRFNEFPPEVQEIAAALDIELTPGMNGLQLFSGVVDNITEVDSPALQNARIAYNNYQNERTQGSQWAETQLNELRHNSQFDENWKARLEEFVGLTARIESERNRNPDYRPSYEQQTQVAEMFTALKRSTDLRVDWDLVWKHKFERTFGPYDWTPPPLPTVFNEDGELNPNAWAPYINQIVDGDTLLVSESPGGENFLGMDQKPRMRSVRLLGVMAREIGEDGGSTDTQRLRDALTQALSNGDTIYLVRDPETYGTNTDQYGRELAYLFIGDEPFYFEEDFNRRLTPSGTVEEGGR